MSNRSDAGERGSGIARANDLRPPIRRVVLRTDGHGVLRKLPPLPAHATVEVTLKVLASADPAASRPAGQDGAAGAARAPARFTGRQGQFLAFISRYTKRYGMPPSEADMARHFMIWPESAHQMVVTLERRRLIAREPGRARSIRVLVPPVELPALE